MSRPDLERAMRTLATTCASSAPLPDANLVWQRAVARAQWRQCELATRPVRLAEGAASIAFAVTGVVALRPLWPGIDAVLRAADQTLVILGGASLAASAAVAFVMIKMLLAED